MGYRNAQIVHVRWKHLTPAPFRLLTWMALRTMDGDTEPTWTGHREDLALGLGHTIPDEPPAGDKTHWAIEARIVRKRALYVVATNIRRLNRAGAIAARWGGYRGMPASYLLNIHNLPLTAIPALAEPVESDAETGDNSVESAVEN